MTLGYSAPSDLCDARGHVKTTSFGKVLQLAQRPRLEAALLERRIHFLLTSINSETIWTSASNMAQDPRALLQQVCYTTGDTATDY